MKISVALLTLAIGAAQAQPDASASFDALQQASFADVAKNQPAVAEPAATQAGCYANGTLLDNIARAQLCLEDEAVSSKQTKKGEPLLNYVVAVLKGGLIQIVKVLHTGDRFQVLTPGVNLTLRRRNGINSDFESDGGGLILAVKYPLMEFPPRVYTPYSLEIAAPEVVQEGLRVQSDFIDTALGRLRASQTPSRRFPGRLVADVVPRKLLTVLLMVEHIDPADFTSADLAEPLVNRVLVILGANKKLAYAHNINHAKARGLVQMTPGTYQVLLKDYPTAGLNPDFAEGATDPINSIMGQALLCDHDWAMIQDYQPLEEDRIGPFLAAAYNGGPRRVIRAILNDKTTWLENPDLAQPPQTKESVKVVKVSYSKKRKAVPVKSHPTNIFMDETMKYVVFYHWVQAYLEKIGAPGFAK